MTSMSLNTRHFLDAVFVNGVAEEVVFARRLWESRGFVFRRIRVGVVGDILETILVPVVLVGGFDPCMVVSQAKFGQYF